MSACPLFRAPHCRSTSHLATCLSMQAMNIHLGATLSIPGVENLSRVGTTSSASLAPKDDPFQGLPFHDLAEYLGEQVMPALEHAKKDQIRQQREAKMAMQNAQVAVPHVPHILPFTRWASTDENFRSTLVVDDDKVQKARLSWYHPDDTVRVAMCVVISQNMMLIHTY